MSAQTPAGGHPFGSLLRRFRLAAGLSQEALAERAQISARAVSDLERGINRAPRHATLLLLIEALNLGQADRQRLIQAARPELTPTTPEPLSGKLYGFLPAPPTPLIGRDADVKRIVDLLLGQARLVTLVGPGGVGKTRMALEIMRQCQPVWGGGVAFIDLSSLRDAELAGAEIALHLGVQPDMRRDIADVLCDVLSDQRALLALDNFEQVIAAAPLVSRLLERCPDLRMVVTSRAPLRLRAETVVQVQPLAIDDAVALLTERAAAAGAPVAVDHDTAVRLCQLGDGLPLAIELLAMRLPSYTPALLLQWLSASMAALSADARDLPPRQRAMSATIAWSYDLLPGPAQSLFRCLGVFEGGGRLSDIAVVWRGEGATTETLNAISTLVEHSLLQVDGRADAPSDEPRYRMLDTIHAFARDAARAAAASGEWDALRRAHAERFARLAAEALDMGAGQERRDAVLWRELPNMRAARAWAHEQGAKRIELTLVTGLGRLLYMHGLTTEGLSWSRAALESGPASVTSAEDVQLWALACYGAARILCDAGDLPSAERYCSDGLEMERAHHLNVSTAELLCVLGQIAQQRGDLSEAGARFGEAVAHARATGNPRAMGTALTGATEAALRTGNLDQAEAYLNEGLALTARLRMPWAEALIRTQAGRLALAHGDISRGREHFHAALAHYRMVGNELYLALCLEGLAAAELAAGLAARAAWLCAAVDALRERAHGPRPSDEQGAFDATVTMARGILGNAAFYHAWNAGHSATREDIIAFALLPLP